MQDDENFTLNNEQLAKNVQSHLVVVEACKTDPAKDGGCIHATGFCLRDGFIFTCLHVVQNARIIYIKSSSTSMPVKATLVYSDPTKDLAVIRSSISMKLSPAKFALSSSLCVGQKIGMAGNLFGMSTLTGEMSVRFGTISGLNRDPDIGDCPKHLIELSIVSSSGDSGCPIFNQKGEVVGMAIASATMFDRFAGLSFAVPLSMKEIVGGFRRSIEDLKSVLDSCHE